MSWEWDRFFWGKDKPTNVDAVTSSAAAQPRLDSTRLIRNWNNCAVKQFRRIAFTCVACRCYCSNWKILGEQAKWHEACHKGKRKTAAAAGVATAAATAIWRIDLGKLFMYSEFITAYSAHKSRAAAQQQQQIELYVLQCQWVPYAATSTATLSPAAPPPGLSQHPLVALSPKLLPPLEMADDG